MNTRSLLGALILLLSLGFGYFVFFYRPQEIKTKCLEIATYTSPVTETKKYGNIGGQKNIDEEIYTQCIGTK